MFDFINFNIWYKYYVGILNEGLLSCHAFVYIQVFDGKPEQIPILWSIIFSVWYSGGLWDRFGRIYSI